MGGKQRQALTGPQHLGAMPDFVELDMMRRAANTTH
jgi:hypothetical protein